MKSAYFLIILFTFVFPFLLSFDKKVHFFTRWKFLFPAMLISMLVFIPWDVFFTLNGVWGFNPQYLSGLYLFHLPVEEWMFFVVVPYACVFIFEVIKAYQIKNFLLHFETHISIFALLILLIITVFHFDKSYTATVSILASVLILLNIFIFKLNFLVQFYFSFLVMLLPFLIINGILTGSLIQDEIVWYNNSENMGIRILTIPVEDIIYAFSLILLNLTIYHLIAERIHRLNTKGI